MALFTKLIKETTKVFTKNEINLSLTEEEKKDIEKNMIFSDIIKSLDADKLENGYGTMSIETLKDKASENYKKDDKTIEDLKAPIIEGDNLHFDILTDGKESKKDLKIEESGPTVDDLKNKVSEVEAKNKQSEVQKRNASTYSQATSIAQKKLDLKQQNENFNFENPLILSLCEENLDEGLISVIKNKIWLSKKKKLMKKLQKLLMPDKKDTPEFQEKIKEIKAEISELDAKLNNPGVKTDAEVSKDKKGQNASV